MTGSTWKLHAAFALPRSLTERHAPHFRGTVPVPGDGTLNGAGMQREADYWRSVPAPPDGRRNKDKRTEKDKEDSHAVWHPKEQNSPSFL